MSEDNGSTSGNLLSNCVLFGRMLRALGVEITPTQVVDLVDSLHYVNIGSRQQGRAQASSVINCEVDRTAISKALSMLFSTEYRRSLYNVANPYGNGGASMRIVAEIKRLEVDKLVKKTFYDLPTVAGGEVS